MNIKQYEWKVVNMFDNPKPEYHTKTELVETSLSSGHIRYLLIHNKDIHDDGYWRTEPVKKVDVTDEMLAIADNRDL